MMYSPTPTRSPVPPIRKSFFATSTMTRPYTAVYVEGVEKALRHKRRWTEDEIKYLQWNWGPGDMRKVVKHLGRSHIAVEKKAVELKLGGVRRGTKTLHQLSRETGYARSTLEIAASNIGLKFHRTFRGGRNPKDRPRDFAISFEQEELIIDYLTKTRHHKMCFRKDGLMSPAGQWGVGRKPPQCTRCKRDDKPHYAKGLCRPCYNVPFNQAARAARGERGIPRVRCPVTGQWKPRQVA